LTEGLLPSLCGQESSGPAGLLEKQAGLIHLGLGDHPPIDYADPIFLGRQLGSCSQAPNDRGLILSRIGSLERAEEGCGKEGSADENHFHQFESRRLKLE
jgi:hypothetical protein